MIPAGEDSPRRRPGQKSHPIGRVHQPVPQQEQGHAPVAQGKRGNGFAEGPGSHAEEESEHQGLKTEQACQEEGHGPACPSAAHPGVEPGEARHAAERTVTACYTALEASTPSAGTLCPSAMWSRVATCHMLPDRYLAGIDSSHTPRAAPREGS